MEFKDFIGYVGMALFVLATLAAFLNLMRGKNPLTGAPWGSNGDNKSAPAAPPLPELSKMPQREIGRIIALSLQHSEGIHSIGSDEDDLIKKSTISKSLFVDEKMLLAAAAQSFTIHKHLRNKAAWAEVMGGHREVWENLRSQGPAGVAFLEKFTNRCIAYGHAATAPSNGIFSGVTLEFAKNLSESDPSAILLSTLTAEQTYQANVIATEHVLTKAKLI